FCTGHSFLPDGRLLVTGGHIALNVGRADTFLFDWRNNSWVSGPAMNDGRWYPTNCSLANGEQLVLSGLIDDYTGMNPLPQVWQNDGTWRSLTDALISLPFYPFLHVAPNGRVFYSGPTQNTRYLDTSGTGAWTPVADSSFGYRDYGSSVLYDDGKVLI